MANAELLHRTLEHIKENPESWDQLRFSTCFAGWTLRLNDPSLREERAGCSCCAVLKKDEYILRSNDIDTQATELLGLTDEQADDLFSGCNTLDDLERVVGELTAEVAA